MYDGSGTVDRIADSQPADTAARRTSHVAHMCTLQMAAVQFSP